MTSATFCIHIDKTYPEGFPAELAADEDEPIEFAPYEELYAKVQEAGLPYYSPVVVESEDTVKFYHFFDRAALERHREACQAKGKTFDDPVNNQKILSICYFAVKCFEPDAENLFRPIALAGRKLEMMPLPPYHNPSNNTALDKALNFFPSPISDAGKKQEMRRMQVAVAELIKKWAIMHHLPPEERKQEELLWLWCASKESHQAAVKLYQACAADPAYAQAKPYLQGLLKKVSASWDPLLPRWEREAILTAQQIVRTAH